MPVLKINLFLWPENIVSFVRINLIAILIKSIYLVRSTLSEKNNELKEQSTIDSEEKPFLSYEEDGVKQNIFKSKLVNEKIKAEIEINQLSVAEMCAWTINGLALLDQDSETITQSRRIEQLTQLRQSFEFLRNYSFELLRATLEKGEKNDN